MDFSNFEQFQPYFEVAVVYTFRVLAVLGIVAISWLGAGLAKRLALRGLNRLGLEDTVARFLASVVRYGVLALAVISCLGIFGVQTASFAAVLGAAGLAVGLALQGTLSNVAAGVLLMVFRPFRVGDFIKAAGVAGTVDSIDLFTTEFRTPDHRKIVAPNSEVFNSVIENVSAHSFRRVDVDVGVDYAADVDQTRQVLEQVLESIPERSKEHESMAFLKGLGASSVDWQLRLWCETADYWNVHQSLIRATKMALDEANIGIPFPQMDVHVRAEEAVKLRSAS